MLERVGVARSVEAWAIGRKPARAWILEHRLEPGRKQSPTVSRPRAADLSARIARNVVKSGIARARAFDVQGGGVGHGQEAHVP